MNIAPPRKKKPAVVMAIIFIASLSLLSEGIEALTALRSFGRNELPETAGTVLLSAIAAAFSGYIIFGLTDEKFTRRRPVSAYLWFMLLLYPITNMARMTGLYLPAPYIENTQLLGAFFAEIFRYVLFIALIVWTALSKSLLQFLSQKTVIPPPLPE